MPRGTAGQTRERILKAADALFYRRGIGQTSVDEVAARAKLNKRTIYYHYPTKTKLVEAYLERRDEVTLDWLKAQARKGGTSPKAQIEALFKALADWSGTPAFSGCPFVRSAVELSGAHFADHGLFRALLVVPEELELQLAVSFFVDGFGPNPEDLPPRRVLGSGGADGDGLGLCRRRHGETHQRQQRCD